MATRTTQQILLVVVMRYSDKAVLATYQNGEVDKEGVREQVASNGRAKPGGKYTAAGDQQCIHYVLDQYSKVYALVTLPSYSPRVAFAALEELKESFQREFGSRMATSGEGSLTKVATPLLKEFVQKFTNPANIDKLSAVQEKLDVVKSVMQENIQQILINQEQVDKINSSAEHLAEQSLAFKSTTKELRNKMFWKMIKMRLLIGAAIVCVLIVIIVPVAVMVQARNNAS
mmetsp:Transcript_1205/g.1221  ORF Transcript_1205/g.1221 Transcript_1205/m.1221 type:complete len:230 (-) Transcript_1205:256-945(-)|eukprot:CAMPEP_0174821402 /NCGR_PEP_ID=MMETSP1107-20130205/7644_1 /TAXON_ID=36770 /ORGANISM="Paraphysomonas vestita, Strain GFlagA" /LENGTH=229 /DNA_ID=CAMNT_0016038379 /DNA_START=47 /DNA_END=736 /DNA_ORIENTATION=+